MPKFAKSHFDRIKIAMTTDFKCSKTVKFGFSLKQKDGYRLFKL